MKGVLTISSLAMMVLSCAPPAIEGGFDSGNPASKMYAIENAAREGDRTAIRKIVDQLDSDDPAVRSLAISALRRLTGESYGYRDFDPRPIRREAIARWVHAIETGELNVQPSAPSPQPTSSSTLLQETVDDHG